MKCEKCNCEKSPGLIGPIVGFSALCFIGFFLIVATADFLIHAAEGDISAWIMGGIFSVLFGLVIVLEKKQNKEESP